MTDALYGPDGFYTSGRGSAGRRGGDFITSPEVGPLFGAVLGRWLDGVWDEQGRPERFMVVDLGAGPGTLGRAIERSVPRCGPSLQMTSADIAGDRPLPTDLAGAVVVANELLDNIPFRWMRGSLEAYVEQGSITWRQSDMDGPDREWPRIDQAAQVVSGLLAAGVARLLAFDYGAETTEELADRGDWLRCYRSHQRGSDPLLEPGMWDITTDVPVDQLPAPTSTLRQHEFLRAHGIDELVEAGRAYWRDYASRPDVQAIEMRSRVNEAEALLDPNGLGGFLAMEWQSDRSAAGQF